MFEKEKYIQCFENIHAPAGMLREILDMTKNEKKKAPLRRRISVAAAVFIAALALSVTGLAAHSGFSPAEDDGSISGFLNNAFGTGIAGQDSTDVALTDSEGNVVKVEHYPATERVALEEELALDLVGDDVVEINQGLTVDDYTIVVRYMLLDENGVGLLAYDVDNPNGHGLNEEGNPADGTPKLSLLLDRSNGEMMDTRTYAQTDSFTATHASFICYFTPFSEFTDSDSLNLSIVATEGDRTFSFPLELEADSGDMIGSVVYCADGAIAHLSPLGLYLTGDVNAKPQGEVVYDDIVINYEDGSAYNVKGEDLVNLAVSSKNSDDKTCWYAFNRLADIDAVSTISVTGHYYAEDGNGNELIYEFVEAD